MLVCVAAIS